ncbi:MAG TPA: ATP-binding protein [Pirellulaceae bacterium]|nr:ATP-binding protein [Pirellulaceae bacterium]HMO91898.1 ATP-binding protein [Pirellulaceae bacterium]HMP68698.1 ATP-binding protein [Pirellulaceae bacterium]
MKNPFATSFTKPGAIPYRETSISISQVLETWQQQSCRGAIVGPHGSGKSSMLIEVAKQLLQSRKMVCFIQIRKIGNGLLSRWEITPRDLSFCETTNWFDEEDLHDQAAKRSNGSGQIMGQHAKRDPLFREGVPQRILLVDGFEQLTWFARFALTRHCQSAHLGLLVTSHRANKLLPTLARTSSDIQLYMSLCHDLISRFIELRADLSDQWSIVDDGLQRAFHQASGNYREAFFLLYDQVGSIYATLTKNEDKVEKVAAEIWP